MKTNRPSVAFALSLLTVLQTLPAVAEISAKSPAAATQQPAQQPAAAATTPATAQKSVRPAEAPREGQQKEAPEATPSADLAVPGQLEDILPAESEAMIKQIMRFAATHYPAVLASAYQVKAAQTNIVTSILSNITASYSQTYTNSHSPYDSADGTYTCPKKPPFLYPCGSYLPNAINAYARTASISASVSLSTIFQINNAALQAQQQQEAKTAVQIATALAAGTAYVKYSISRFQLAFYARNLQLINSLNSVKNALPKLQQTTLDSKENDFRTKSYQAYSSAATALNDLTMYVDPKLLPEIEKQVDKTSNAQANAVFSRGRNGLNLTQLSKFMPAPARLQDAYVLAKKAPALVQAKLSEDIAQNSFFLVLSSVGPKFTATASSTTSYTDTNIATKGDTIKMSNVDPSVQMSISFALNFGTPTQAMGSNYQYKAAQLTNEVSKRTVLNSIGNLYASETLQLKLIEMNAAQLQSDLEQFSQAVVPQADGSLASNITTENVSSYVNLETDIVNTSSSLTTSLITSLTNRLQVHAATGALLAQIGVDPTKEVITDATLNGSRLSNADTLLKNSKKMTEINAN